MYTGIEVRSLQKVKSAAQFTAPLEKYSVYKFAV